MTANHDVLLGALTVVPLLLIPITILTVRAKGGGPRWWRITARILDGLGLVGGGGLILLLLFALGSDRPLLDLGNVLEMVGVFFLVFVLATVNATLDRTIRTDEQGGPEV